MNVKIQKGDIFGGLTAGIVALPLALAFGVQSGLGAEAGLYGAMMIGLFGAVFGGTKTQISGPTGPMTVVSATVVSTAIANYGGIESAMGIIILTFFLTGLFQVVFGMMKIGKYIKYIPYPVLSGFMSGIGIIIILLQVFPALGLVSPSRVIDVVTGFPDALASLNPVSLGVTAITIIIIYLAPYVTKVVPGTLIALIIVTLIVHFFSLDTALIGSMPEGLPGLKLGALKHLSFSGSGAALVPALTLAGLGAIDSLLTSVVADNITKTKHNSNKELIGQGIGNMAASLFGGIPGAGATMRTVVNVRSGGKTRASGVIHALFLLLILLGLGKYVSYIPLATLAGVLITVGIGILDLKGLKKLLSMPRSDGIILVVVLSLTIFVDLLQAVGIGMVMASLIFMRKASDMVENNTSLSRVDGADKEVPWDDEAGLDLHRFRNVYIKRLDGPVFFGVAARIMERVNKIPKDAKVVIFRMKKVPFIDMSGLFALEDVVKEMHAAGITVVFTMTQDQPMYLFQKNKMVPGIIPRELMFSSIEECAEWLKVYIKNID